MSNPKFVKWVNTAVCLLGREIVYLHIICVINYEFENDVKLL